MDEILSFFRSDAQSLPVTVFLYLCHCDVGFFSPILSTVTSLPLLADELDFVFSRTQEAKRLYLYNLLFSYYYLYGSVVLSWKFHLSVGSLSQRPLIILDQVHLRERELLQKGYKLEYKKGSCAGYACCGWMCSEAFPMKGIGYNYSTGHESNTATGPSSLVL